MYNFFSKFVHIHALLQRVTNGCKMKKSYVRLPVFLVMSIFGNLAYAQGSKCYDLDEILKVEPTPLYAPHLKASQKSAVSVLKDGTTVSKYQKTGKLVTVKSLGKGYRIQKLQYSKAVLSPRSKTVLKDIATAFFGRTKGSTLTFTSLTRTLEDQCRLRKVNRNASLGLSSHNYGNSFDISYVRFNDRLEPNDRLDKILEKLLKEYEKSGKIYYIREKQQACYHVTVR